jgi:hypothetical protein
METHETDQWGISVNGPRYWLAYRPFSREDCVELMAGRVPEWLREAARGVVEWSLPTLGVDYVGLNANLQRKRENAAAKRPTPRATAHPRA